MTKNPKKEYRIKVKNEKALEMLKGMAAANLIEIEKTEIEVGEKTTRHHQASPIKLSEQLKKSFTTTEAQSLSDHLEQVRNEWDRI
jgi:hypothetical protein